MTYPTPEPYPSPGEPVGPSSEDRGWAMAAHLGTLVAAWFALGLLAPLVTLLVRGQQSQFVRRHSIESLNFQISLLIYLVVAVVVGFVLTLVTFGLGLVVIIPVVIVAALILFVLIVVAGVKAWNGEEFRYPLTIRFLS